MARLKRARRAQNTIADSLPGGLIKTGPSVEIAFGVEQSRAIRLARPTLFSAEFERVIEIIARERVYREMLARMGRRLLMAPPANPD